MSSNPWDGFEEEYHPKQRLFVSIDAIGSTALKTERLKDKDGGDVIYWASPLLDFLPEVSIIFLNKFIESVKYCPTKQCPHKCTNSGSEKWPHIKPWKYVGDEVVLSSELRCRHQPHLLVNAALETLKELNKRSKTKENRSKPKASKNGENTHRTPLSFKGTAWTAGFPTANIEVDLPGENEEVVRDYLGPSIDLGFRLSKMANKNKLVISTSLAYFLNDVNIARLKTLKIYTGGGVELKGVKNGWHAFFWIPTIDAENDLAEALTFAPAKDQLDGFFESYFGHDKPFIVHEGTFEDSYRSKYTRSIKKQKSLNYSPFNKIKDHDITPQENHEKEFNQLMEETEKGISTSKRK